MCHRDSAVCGDCNRRRNPGYNLKGDIIFPKRLRLLASPSKDKGISALQSDYQSSLLSLFHQNPVNLLLGSGMKAASFSHINLFCRARYKAHNPVARQGIVNNGVRRRQQFPPFYGHQAGISRSRAYQIHFFIKIMIFHFRLQFLFIISFTLSPYFCSKAFFSVSASFTPSCSASSAIPSISPVI